MAHNGPHYPSHLDLYIKCPHRYRLQVIERRRVDEPFSPALARGTATHRVLKYCGMQLMRTPPRCPADLHLLTEAHLPRERYPSEAAWRAEIEEIVGWVKFGLAYIDPAAKILGVEQHLSRMHRGPDGDDFPVGAIIDLLLLRTDVQGKPYIEVVDYKTGRSGWENPFAPVMTRFVLKPLIARHLPGQAFGRFVWTELYLAERFPQNMELDLPYCLEQWEMVKRLAGEIAVGEFFPAAPSEHTCRFCPYRGNGCDAGMPEVDDGELW